MIRNILLTITLLLATAVAKAQTFFNLTADEVKIDPVLPVFSYSKDLGPNYADSTYSVTIDYPEFIDMSENDVSRLKNICNATLPSLPEINTRTVVERKRGKLDRKSVV